MNLNEDAFSEEVSRGLRLFSQEEYYEAHEAFETAWRSTQTPDRELYRALLQVSGGFFRLTQTRPKAARKFFMHALKWLALFPDQHHGFDVYQLKEDLHLIINSLDHGQVDHERIKQFLHTLDR